MYKILRARAHISCCTRQYQILLLGEKHKYGLSYLQPVWRHIHSGGHGYACHPAITAKMKPRCSCVCVYTKLHCTHSKTVFPVQEYSPVMDNSMQPKNNKKRGRWGERHMQHFSNFYVLVQKLQDLQTSSNNKGKTS